jgi:hypothetical protein
MLSEVQTLKPEVNDLVVVPEAMTIPEGLPFHIYRMKFLLKPSIIRTGGYNMGLLEKLNSGTIANWLGFKSKPAVETNNSTSLRDIVFDSSIYGKMRGDSTLHHKVPTINHYVLKGDAPVVSESLFAEDAVITNTPLSESFQEGLSNFHKAMNEFIVKEPPVQQHIPTKTTSSVISQGPSGKVTLIPKRILPRLWRYSRPTEEIEHLSGVAKRVLPKGGVAFYIELDPENKTFAFSYALCHTDENFNRSIARHISKQRFENDDWYEVKNYDGSKSIIENIGIAISNELYNRNIDDTMDISFSSLSDRMNETELKQIFERI